jgi:hypothetical protein
MQSLQVANGVKRVTGDPVKGGFQCHDQFAKEMYCACNRYMMRMFISLGYFNKIDNVTFLNEESHLRWILVYY